MNSSTESAMAIDQVPALVRQLYALVAEFERLFPGRKFTPDGHLVGSIGEVLAAHRYDLKLHSASAEKHDAVTQDGRQVQIKATQASTVALRAEPELLLVLKLEKDGQATEIYNGPGAVVWSKCGPIQKNGQRPISVSNLKKLMMQPTLANRVSYKNNSPSADHSVR